MRCPIRRDATDVLPSHVETVRFRVTQRLTRECPFLPSGSLLQAEGHQGQHSGVVGLRVARKAVIVLSLYSTISLSLRGFAVEIFGLVAE